MISIYAYTEYGQYNVWFTKVSHVGSKSVDLAYIAEEVEDVILSMNKTCVIANDEYTYEAEDSFSGIVLTGCDKFFVESGYVTNNYDGHIACDSAMKFCRKLYDSKILLNSLMLFRSFIVDSVIERKLGIHFPASIWLLRWMQEST